MAGLLTGWRDWQEWLDDRQAGRMAGLLAGWQEQDWQDDRQASKMTGWQDY
jgi:hypothetical protein